VRPLPQEVAADSIRTVLRQVFADPEYDWEFRRNPFQFFFDMLGSVAEWLARLEVTHPVAYWILMGVMAGLLVAILLHFTYLVVRALRPRVGDAAPKPVSPIHRRGAAWHLEEASRLAAEGRYQHAIAHRFAALLFVLDEHKVIRFHPSKTPAEYAAEIDLAEEGIAKYKTLVGALYQHLFGGVDCSDRDLYRFDQQATAISSDHARP
jgi:hypothetical protein